MNRNKYPRPYSRLSLFAQRIACLIALILLPWLAGAQAPTSLQYPPVTVANTNVSPLFLSPTVSGNVASYSITPALPAAVSLDPNTGVISGTPTAANTMTTYTVTATNGSGSTTAALNLAVYTTTYNAGFDTVRFINSGSTITAIRGNGKAVGDSILYKSVITIGGQAIDCIVTTLTRVNVDTMYAYDFEGASTIRLTNNLTRYFTPLMNLTGAGGMSFNFQFILGNSFVNAANPGGFNFFTIPAGAFKHSDADGTVDSVVITGFPTGANYLKVGTTVYINGGTCPPQSTCTTWPGTLRLAVGALSDISVDPASAGNTTVTVPFTVKDNGLFTSNGGVPSSVLIPFTVPGSPISVSGNVWVDGNANGILNSNETYTAVAASGQALYAMLVQTTNTYSGVATIYASTPVTAAATGYTFSDVPSGNAYEVRIASLAAAPAAGAAWNIIIPALAAGHMGVSTNNNGTITDHQNTVNLVNALGVVTANKTAVNFGIEQAPVADAKAFTAPNGAFTTDAAVQIGGVASQSILANNNLLSGSAIRSLSGTDAEDCATASSCTTARSYRIQTINANTRLFYYNGSAFAELLANSTIASFDPANLRIHGQAGQGYTVPTTLGFTYRLIDSAGMASPAVTYALQTANAPLPLMLISFTGTASACTAQLAWTSDNDASCLRYDVEQSGDGRSFQTAATIASNRSAAGGDYTALVPMTAGQSYYRLKMVGADGTATFSAAIALRTAGCGAAVIAVSPNPAQTSVRIAGLTSAARVRVMNATGKVMLEVAGVENGDVLDLARLAAGMYVLQATDAAGVSHCTVVKR